MARNALVTVRPRGPGPKPRGIPVARTPQQWAAHDAPHLDLVRTMAAAGASLPEIGAAMGGRSVKTVREFMRRNAITPCHRRDTHAVLVLIEPVRWPDGPGRQGGIRHDFEDTDEL